MINQQQQQLPINREAMPIILHASITSRTGHILHLLQFRLGMEKIKSLIKDRPYESDTLQILEAYVATEFSSNNEAYSFDANKALIKIYQAFPEHMKAEVLANIFEMALVRSVHINP